MAAHGFNLLTGGLVESSGLSLTTAGLLILDLGSGAAEEIAFETPERLYDIATVDPETGLIDLRVEGGDVAAESTLRSAVFLSLFSDARATQAELARYGFDKDTDPRGWWGDELAAVAGDRFGSKLWLITRAKQIDETLTDARVFTTEALRWIQEDGIAQTIAVETAWMDRLDSRFSQGTLGIGVGIEKPRQPDERYAFLWSL